MLSRLVALPLANRRVEDVGLALSRGLCEWSAENRKGFVGWKGD